MVGKVDDLLEKFLISIDLEKFSPKFNLQLKKDVLHLLAVWFGIPEIEDLIYVNYGADVHFKKHNISMKMVSKGCDFEGMFGKLNTIIHTAILGWAVMRLKEDNIITKGIRLNALIDDGAISYECDENFTPI